MLEGEEVTGAKMIAGAKADYSSCPGETSSVSVLTDSASSVNAMCL